MADFANSTPAPSAQQGPVTLAIRAVAAEHEPTRNKVVSLAAVRAKRAPYFTPFAFNFPLTDTLWSTVYLQPVRFAVEFVSLSGREAVARLTKIKPKDDQVAVRTDTALTLAIDHFEELIELLRTARSRLREADAAVEANEGRARQ